MLAAEDLSYGDKKYRRFCSWKVRLLLESSFALGKFVRDFQGFARQAGRRLAVLEAATSVDALQALRCNRLEVLRGDRQGQHSIRINLQWRICFIWPAGEPGPSNVEIADYH